MRSNRRYRKIHLYHLVTIILLVTNFLCAQNNKKFDSIFKVASSEMYVNPDRVIKNGRLIVNESGKDIDYKIMGYKLISDGYSSKRDYEKSLAYVVKANQLLNYTNNKILKISTLNKTGIQYHQLKIYDKSIEYLDQAEHLMMEYPVPDSIRSYLGKNYIVRGFIYKEKFNCEIAIDFFDKGISELLKSKSKPENSAISIAKYNKGNCYILMLNNKLARVNFQEAIQNAKVVNAKSLQAFALKGLAQVYTIEGDFQLAIQTLKESLLISAKVNDLILNQEIFKGLSENYLAINEWENFKKYQNEYLFTQKLIKDRERKSVSESLDLKDKYLDEKFKNEIPNYYYKIAALFLSLITIVVFFFFIIRKNIRNIKKLKAHIHLLQNAK